MKLDMLAFGIHPDDVELSCSGTLAKHKSMGYTIGICDLTAGEMGTRGSKELRLEEAEKARKILNVDVRENLFMEDVWATKSKENILKIIAIIRKYQPDIVFCNSKVDRHPDHAKGAEMVREAVFLAGLKKISTKYNGKEQEEFRPKNLYYYVQSRFCNVDFVVDISDVYDIKLESIFSYSSQFYNPDSTEPETYISDKDFINMVKAKDIIWGKSIGVKYAEGFQTDRFLGISDLTKII